MEHIFNNLIDDTNKIKQIFDEPFNVDYNLSHSNSHFINAYFIYNNKLSVSKKIKIKDNIDCFYFVYVDYGMKRWDDKYWFCIGKTKDNLFFSYESTCCGTGFGLGSCTKIHYSKDKELLITYGIENKHRTLINENKKLFLRLD